MKLVHALTVEAEGAMATGEEVEDTVVAMEVEVVGLEEDGRGDTRIFYLSLLSLDSITSS